MIVSINPGTEEDLLGYDREGWLSWFGEWLTGLTAVGRVTGGSGRLWRGLARSCAAGAPPKPSSKREVWGHSATRFRQFRTPYS